MKLNGFIGGSYTLNSINVESQRSVNLYPEIIETGLGKDGATIYLKSTPGLRKKIEVGAGPIRCVHVDPLGTLLVISGFKAYRVNHTDWTSTEVGTLETIADVNTPVSAASYANASGGVTVFADSSGMNYIYASTSAFAGYFAPYSGVGYPPVPLATQVAFLDGYIIFIVPSENKFYVSDWNSPLVSALDFATSEGSPDPINACIVNHRDLWIFNEKTTEVFVNTGNSAFPLERVGGGFLEIGCLAPWSVAKIDGTIFWLARDEFGKGSVYSAHGINPQKISTHSIDQAISKYANPEKARAYTYSKDGHSYYVLNFAENTWVYDLSTKMWHERCYNNEGLLERHRANTMVYFDTLGLHICGDYSSNKIYSMEDGYYFDDTVNITRLRIFPHLSNSLKRLFCNSLQIDMEVGVGNPVDPGQDPQVMLSYSNDGGHTWSSESWTSAGKNIGGVGEYKKRVIWRRLGSFRDRVFKIKITDPVKVTLISAEIEVEQGAN